MAKLYVVGHGGLEGGGTTFVPKGRVVHSYAKEGELLSSLSASTILASGGSETGLVVLKAGRAVLNWSLYPDNSSELQRDMSAMAEQVDGEVLFIRDETKLCSTPDVCRPLWLDWRRAREEQRAAGGGTGPQQPPPDHAAGCTGLFRTHKEYDEIHLLVCQSFVGLGDTSGRRTGVPKLVRQDGVVQQDKDGENLVDIDYAQTRKWSVDAAKLLKKGQKDPIGTLTYLHNVLPQQELAQLRNANSAFNKWVDATWDYYQTMAPWDYEHQPASPDSKYEQYQKEDGEPVPDGWLDADLRRRFGRKQVPASFGDCMSSTWSEVFFKWMFSDYVNKEANGQVFEWAYFLWDVTARWDRSEVSTDQVVELIRTHDIGRLIPDAAELIDRLEQAMQRHRHATLGDRTADESTRVDGADSVVDCMSDLLAACRTWMDDIYDNEFVPQATAALSA